MRERLRALSMMVSISFRADATRSIAAVLTATGQMVSVPFRALGFRDLANGVVTHDRGVALSGVGLIIVLTALTRLLTWASYNVRMRLRENTEVWLDSHLMSLTSGIPGLEAHESPEYLDRVELLRRGRWELANPFNPISWSIGGIAQLVSIVVLLAGVQPVLALLPLSAAVSVWATVSSQRALVALYERSAEVERGQRHLFDLSTQPRAAKEVRIFGLAPELLRRRKAAFTALNRARRGVAERRVAQLTAGWICFGIAYAAALAFTVQLATAHRVSVGDVVLVVSVGSQLNSQLAGTIETLRWFVQTHRAVTRLVWLSDYAATAGAAATPERRREAPRALTTGVRLEHVSFVYPGTASPAVEDIDVMLPAGSTVALVGENGSGKTTLVKLLCRFYEPAVGRITVDGIDVRDFAVSDWRSRLAAGFQDFMLWELVAREAVGMGDITQSDVQPAVVRALDRAAAGELPAQLPQRLDTQLGRSFAGGVELSVGQWQKVALARAMMRETPLLLMLDEPTASLDAQTEHALFERYARTAREQGARNGAIAVIVSHRFSTVRMADVILVMHHGRLVEQGDHAGLMRRGGTYADLFSLQARAYR